MKRGKLTKKGVDPLAKYGTTKIALSDEGAIYPDGKPDVEALKKNLSLQQRRVGHVAAAAVSKSILPSSIRYLGGTLLWLLPTSGCSFNCTCRNCY